MQRILRFALACLIAFLSGPVFGQTLKPAAEIKQAQAARDAEVERSYHRDALKRLAPPPASKPRALVAGPVALADMQALALKLDFTGDGDWSAADLPGLQNAIGSLTTWKQTTAVPTGLAGAVAGQTVTLTWTNQAQPDAATIQVRRNGTLVASIAGTLRTTTDNPGAGSWTYDVRAMTTSYEGAWSAPVMVTVAGTQPALGWTDLTPIPGSLVLYVSSSLGSDGGQGSQSSPFKTIGKAYASMRDGQPDQVLLKCGDTWAESISWLKSANSNTAYMVLGSYGTGARPTLTVNGDIGVYFDHNRHGLAIVGINFQGPGNGTGFTAITGFSPASHILIEGCRFDGLPTGIVMQETVTADRLSDVKIRRNVYTNIVDTGSGHSQGNFIGNTDGLVIEGNVFYKIALNKADMFCHANYLSETDGTSVFKDNIVSMACSHGVQQRSGGTMTGNLFLRNPINAFQGNAQGGGGPVPSNVCRYNVALDSRNIGPNDGRGFGFALAGGSGSVVEYNIAAFQVSGTDAIVAFDFDQWQGNSVRNNVAWDWAGPNAGNPGWPVSFQFNNSFGGSPVISGNTLVNHLNGQIVRFEFPWAGQFSGNTYYTASPDAGVGGYLRFATDAGVGASLAQWRTLTGDPSVFLSAAPAQKAGNIGDYLTRNGIAPGSDPTDTFMQGAILYSRQHDDPKYTAPVVTADLRGVFGVAQPTSP